MEWSESEERKKAELHIKEVVFRNQVRSDEKEEEVVGEWVPMSCSHIVKNTMACHGMLPTNP